jgi:hypothetical protein
MNVKQFVVTAVGLSVFMIMLSVSSYYLYGMAVSVFGGLYLALFLAELMVAWVYYFGRGIYQDLHAFKGNAVITSAASAKRTIVRS